MQTITVPIIRIPTKMEVTLLQELKTRKPDISNIDKCSLDIKAKKFTESLQTVKIVRHRKHKRLSNRRVAVGVECFNQRQMAYHYQKK